MGSVDSQDRIKLASRHTALQNSLPGVVMPSFGRGIDPNTPFEMGASLHDASKTGQLEIVRSFLSTGVDVNERDKYFMTPLSYASKGGKFEVAQLLIECGADINTPNRTGWTPLHLASLYGHIDDVRLLLDHGADVNAKKQDRWTALHLAVINDSASSSFGMVKALLQQGASIHATNDEGRTPFQVASRVGNREIMRLLSQYGADGL